MGNRDARHVWMRAALLLCLMLGVGAMHTLGHLETAHAAETHGVIDDVANHATAESGSQSPDNSDRGDLPPTDPTSMCLALAGLLLVLAGIGPSAFHRWPTARGWRRGLAPVRPAGDGRIPDPPSLSCLQVLRI